MTGVLNLFALANNFQVGKKLLPREALEAKAVGGASTVKEERKPRPVVSLTARSEPYNRTALHVSRLDKARMRQWNCGKRRGREKPRLAAATSRALSDRHRQGQCLRVLQRRAPSFVPKRKTRSLWLPARVDAEPAVSRCRARMRCGDGRSDFHKRCGRA